MTKHTDYPTPNRTEVNDMYWSQAEEGQLVIQFCGRCQDTYFPPRVACPHCLEELEWINASGNGTVYSYGIVHRPSQPSVFNEDVPFVLGVIELEEGCRIVSHIIECEPKDVEIGKDVRVVFDEVATGVHLPKFELV